MSTHVINDIYNDQLPYSVSHDEQVQAFGEGQDVRLKLVLPYIDQIRVLCNIDAQTEAVLDLLALQFEVLFYSGTQTIPDAGQRLRAKQNLIHQSFHFMSTLGTKAVLQNLVSSIYSNALVQEWFEYGGTAHHFRILLENVISDPNITSSIINFVTIVKRASSYFEGFVTSQKAPAVNIVLYTAPYAQSFIQGPKAT